MPPRRKRAHELIDLTADDDDDNYSIPARVPKAPRTSASSSQARSSLQGSRPTQSSQQLSSQSGNKYIGPSSIYAGLSQLASSFGPAQRLASQQQDNFDDDDDDDEPELTGLTQSDDGPLLEFYGSIDDKIVGCRYYNGIVSPGEVVILRREPRNQ